VKKYCLQISNDTVFTSNLIIDNLKLTQNYLLVNDVFQKNTKYFWRVKGIIDDNIETGWSDIFNFSTASENSVNYNNYNIINKITVSPNPAQNSAFINYSIQETSLVTIEIINIYGQKVLTIHKDKLFNSGDYKTELNIENMQTGMYFCTLQINNQTLLTKFNIIK
jgi:hypothetical protein